VCGARMCVVVAAQICRKMHRRGAGRASAGAGAGAGARRNAECRRNDSAPATDANPQTHLNACNAEEQRAARAIRNILAIEQIVDADLEEIAALAIEVKRVILLHKVHRGEQHLFEADL